MLTLSGHAIRRAGFHYKNSKRIGMRVSIARISTDGLIAATVTAQMETTITVTTRRRFHPDETYLASKVHNVSTPVWIRDTAATRSLCYNLAAAESIWRRYVVVDNGDTGFRHETYPSQDPLVRYDLRRRSRLRVARLWLHSQVTRHSRHALGWYSTPQESGCSNCSQHR
jgi:hypothetical protein